MTHGPIRTSGKALIVFATLAIVSACSDKNAAAPTSNTVSIVAPANFNLTGTQVVFSVDNAVGTTQRIGNHVINIPANAICDLATSGYGASYWDQPCAPLAGSILITGTVLEDADGQPYVDFQPAMRFAPDKEVMLFLRQGHNSDKKQLIVQWCNNLGYCVDESLADPSLTPFRLGRTPIIGRRVKHFSGYMISAGEGCNGTVTDNGDGTWWCDEGGFQRRSGYMVASGKDVSDVLKDGDKGSDQVDPGRKKGEQ